MVEEQRQLMFDHRQGLLEDDGGSRHLRRSRRPSTTRRWRREVGARTPCATTERRLALILLDRRWSDHLALIDDIREGIHLQRYGGRLPLTEFQRQIIDAYAAMMEGLRDEVVETFTRLRAESGVDRSRPRRAARAHLHLDLPGQRQPAAVVRACS